MVYQLVIDTLMLNSYKILELKLIDEGTGGQIIICIFFLISGHDYARLHRAFILIEFEAHLVVQYPIFHINVVHFFISLRISLVKIDQLSQHLFHVDIIL